MKQSQETTDSAVKNGKISEINKKKETNISKNSSLYFQIGLIICLLGTYVLFEMNFETQLQPRVTYDDPFEDVNPFVFTKFNVEPDAPKQKPALAKPVALLIDKAPIIKPNDFVIKNPMSLETPESLPTVTTPNPVVPDLGSEAPVTPVNKEWNMIDVERVPIFPGCESASNNAERMACMSEKLSKYIQRKFNTDLASQLGLSGVQKIYVQFKIDNKGHVTDIKSRSPYSQLEQEAERVVSKLPVMTPGMQRDTPVSVVYNLPIVFQVY